MFDIQNGAAPSYLNYWIPDKNVNASSYNTRNKHDYFIPGCALELFKQDVLWNTMPLTMANSNEGQDHKDKYFDTSRKILSQEMITCMCNIETLVSYF